jgi:peptide/nickel transport system ATP-binding protein
MNEHLTINNLSVYYPKRKGIMKRIAYYIKAVNNVSFSIEKGKILGLVGESGCGKSSLGKAVIGLSPVTKGSILLNNQDLQKNIQTNRRLAASKVQMIFQDPYSSLNPKMPVGQAVSEAVKVSHPDFSESEVKEKAIFYLKRVGIDENAYYKYPHEFSGGQRQRIGIARALSVNPELIICDECVSSLDVSIQASILNLLLDIQDEFNLTYLFISHDLSVVKFIADTIAVMYLGEIVELGNSDKLFTQPRHPYTKALLSAVPNPVPDNEKTRILLTGDVPSPVNLPEGCYFENRCQKSSEKCKMHPNLQSDNHYQYRCFYPY